MKCVIHFSCCSYSSTHCCRVPAPACLAVIHRPTSKPSTFLPCGAGVGVCTGAPYERKYFALELMALLLQQWLHPGGGNGGAATSAANNRIPEPFLSCLLSPACVETLLGCVVDSWDKMRVTASRCVSHCVVNDHLPVCRGFWGFMGASAKVHGAALCTELNDCQCWLGSCLTQKDPAAVVTAPLARRAYAEQQQQHHPLTDQTIAAPRLLVVPQGAEADAVSSARCCHPGAGDTPADLGTAAPAKPQGQGK